MPNIYLALASKVVLTIGIAEGCCLPKIKKYKHQDSWLILKTSKFLGLKHENKYIEFAQTLLAIVGSCSQTLKKQGRLKSSKSSKVCEKEKKEEKKYLYSFWEKYGMLYLPTCLNLNWISD